MTALSPNKIQPGYEPIPGYVLEKLIGRGGYGEVWRAEAPGGIKKAVKFVFGERDDHRAQQELKSLERIKGVQHPFILTLERFEVVDDRLVIVTEIADCSLDELFKERRQQGSCGLARKQLLTFMRDTADALDYLHNLYKLQHLDIKPANLLIVGGRVKVADFGLLKDLRDVECSVIGGLTPIYAPPELFDGRPSMHSDQYSLAVMYQELLTGTRPFSGRTIAQLATQHIHNAPNLKPLPPGDRPVVARALEKSPERRFSNCTEFVDALIDERHAPKVDVSAATTDSDPVSEVQDLPELKAGGNADAEIGVSRALVVGLGGTGADCVSMLRDRVAELRSMSPLSLHSVVIDVDPNSSLGDDRESVNLPYQRNINTPLRSALDYRNRGTEHLKSISRRWLYNIPRSGATEGMRPLGRLALVDHAKEVTDGLREAVENLVAAAGGQTPAIYLVGSLAGGTGSGMFIDVAYLLRNLLDKAGLHDVEVMSLLTTVRMQGDPSRPLVLHDTSAALKEIKYFLQPGNSYPGDTGANWPSMPAARTPLHNTYVIATSQIPRAPAAIETLVDYLWIDATAARSFLDTARHAEAEGQDGSAPGATIRSVGLIPLSGTRRLEENVLAPSTTRHLLRHWLGNPDQSRKLSTPLVERVSRHCQLSPSEMVERELQLFGEQAETRRQRILDRLQGMQSDGIDEQRLREFIGSTLKVHGGEDDVAEVMAKLQREMVIRLIDRRLDFAAAIKAAHMMSDQMRCAAEQLTAKSESLASESDAGGDETTLHRAERILLQLATDAAGKRAKRIQERLSLLEQKLSIRAMVLAKAIRSVKDGKKGGSSAWDDMEAPIREQFDHVIEELHGLTAQDWLVKLVGEGGGNIRPPQLVEAIAEAALPLICRVVIAAGGCVTSSSSSAPPDISSSNSVSATTRFHLEREELSAMSAPLTEVRDAMDAARQDELPVLTIEEAVRAVRPALLDCGGYQRLMLIVGSKAEQEVFEPQVQQFHQGSLTTVVIDSARPMLIHEAQRILIDDVAKRMTTLAGGGEEISRRLVSRSDIDWRG